MPSSVKVVSEVGKDLEIPILCETTDGPSGTTESEQYQVIFKDEHD